MRFPGHTFPLWEIQPIDFQVMFPLWEIQPIPDSKSKGPKRGLRRLGATPTRSWHHTDKGPEIYSVTGTEYNCTQSSNRGYIWVQTAKVPNCWSLLLRRRQRMRRLLGVLHQHVRADADN